jgi:CubicO group peptidase (beta-lactamase class C family)
MRIRSNISFFAVSVLLLVNAASVHSQSAPLAGLDDYIEKARQEWKVPGMSVAIVKDDKIVYAKGFGVKKLGETNPVDDKTLFAIGSSSKAFTAAALAMLVDEGKLKWDDAVISYLPEFELYDPYVTREMTIRDLLCHRSGLERGDFLWYGTDLSREEIIRRARYLKPSWSLRSRFGYQNLMYLTAGQVVARVSGMSWDDFVAKRIFTPLGMTTTGTSIKAFKPGSNVSTPHADFENTVQPIAWRDIDNIAPAGSINSNVQEMAQWVRLQLGQGTIDGKKIFSAATSKEMHTPQTIIRLDGQYPMMYPEAHFFSYGLGWFLSDFKGRKLVEHGGAIDGMRAEVALVPEEKLGVVILTNMNGSLISNPLVYRIIDAYLGNPARDYSSELYKAYKPLLDQAAAAQKKAEAERILNTKPSLDISQYAGTYSNELYGNIKITNDSGQLKFAFGPAFTSNLEHWNYDTFQATFTTTGVSKAPVTFSLNPQGKVDSLVFGVTTAAYPFKRMPDDAKTPVAASNK